MALLAIHCANPVVKFGMPLGGIKIGVDTLDRLQELEKLVLAEARRRVLR